MSEFVPSVDNAKGWTDLYRPIDVSLAKEVIDNQAKAQEHAQARREAQKHADDLVKAKMLEEIEKTPPHTRPEDDALFQEETIKHNKIINDNMEAYMSGDIKRSVPATIAMKNATTEFASKVKASDDVRKRLEYIDKTIQQDEGGVNPVMYRNKEGLARQRVKRYDQIDWNDMPPPMYNYQKDSKENLVPYLKQTGTVKEEPLLINGKPQYLPNGGIVMVQSEEADPVALNNDFHAHYVENPNLPKETELTYGERQKAGVPLRPSLVTENGLVQGKVPTYQDYMQKDVNGTVGFNAPQFYADQLTPFVATKSKVVNSAGQQSVTGAGGIPDAKKINASVTPTGENTSTTTITFPTPRLVNIGEGGSKNIIGYQSDNVGGKTSGGRVQVAIDETVVNKETNAFNKAIEEQKNIIRKNTPLFENAGGTKNPVASAGYANAINKAKAKSADLQKDFDQFIKDNTKMVDVDANTIEDITGTHTGANINKITAGEAGHRVNTVINPKQEGAQKATDQYEYNGKTATEAEWLKAGWTKEQLAKHAKKK